MTGGAGAALLGGYWRGRSAMELLLSLAEPEHAEAAGARIGEEWRRNPPTPWPRLSCFHPVSAHLWTLQHDDPELNAEVYRARLLTGVVRAEIRQGLPFGPGARGRVPVLDRVRLDTGFPENESRFADPAQLVAALRAGVTVRRARAAALRVGRDDWEAVVGADRQDPLPGYARWALSVRPDRPGWARGEFGAHPVFAARLRKAGVYDSPRELLDMCRPSVHALRVLHQGLTAFPRRREALGPLRELVRGRLGADTAAWVRLARLLPDHDGTVPELFDAVGRHRTARGRPRAAPGGRIRTGVSSPAE